MSFRSPLPVLLAAALALGCARARSHSTDESTSVVLLQARQQFQQDRFGLFVRWGVHSVLGEGESAMEDRKIPVSEYEKTAASFDPKGFDAAEWVALARSAGARYLTFTAKSSDGFAMWDSAVSDWDVVERTPFARDVVGELSAECRRNGLKLFLYYSQLDWRHPDYFPRGRTGRAAGRPESGEWTRYLDFMDAQLGELLTRYGTVDGVWFDGWHDRRTADWRLEKTFKQIRALQPRALIGTNRRPRPEPGEDFMIYERFLPGDDMAGFSATSELAGVPLETCDSMDADWGYRSADASGKPTRELVSRLVRAAGSNANFLLGVGPAPDGRIPAESARRLREMGMWLAKNGESIYGTQAGPLPPQPWGAVTARGKKLYVHVLDAQTSSVVLQLPRRRVVAARYLGDEDDVPFRDEAGTVTLTLRPERPGELARAAVLYTE